MAEDKVGFNDPIHGYMEFDPLLVKIIHTPYFQRMKDIKQLGGSYWIFPGASHNRFEHSLGTAHLAGMMIERLKDADDSGKYVTDEDILCVKIAALCHDLGHGPFSHVFDTTMKEKLIEYHENEIKKLSDAEKEKKEHHENYINELKDWKHEDASCKLFDYMIENTAGLKEAFEEKNLGEKERRLIKEIIKGKDPKKVPVSGDGEQKVPVSEDDKEKWFLFEIVANKVNEIDCDKFDYFARDCHNLGMKSNFDHLRYINNILILPKPNTNELHLCVRDKLAFNIYELFHTRWSLHRRAYQHKTTKAIEEMLTDAFVLMEEKYRFSAAISNMEEYAKLTDSVFYEILRSSDTDEKTRKAQEILRRIQQRNLYKFYEEFQPREEVKLDDDLEVTKKIAELSDRQVGPDDFFVRTVKIHFGQEQHDPVKSVIFYKKKGKDEKEPQIGEQIGKDDVSRMLPEKFSERYVRVYGKNSTKGDIDKKKIVLEYFKKWREKTFPDYQWTHVAGLTALAMTGAAGILKFFR